jgi:hypothetical protein
MRDNGMIAIQFKTFVILAVLNFPLHAIAATEHTCIYGGFVIKLVTDGTKDVPTTFIKKSDDVTVCNMVVTSYDDGKKGVSSCERTVFEMIACDSDNVKTDFHIKTVDHGSIKMCPGDNYSSVDLIENIQPLKCAFVTSAVEKKEPGSRQ